MKKNLLIVIILISIIINAQFVSFRIFDNLNNAKIVTSDHFNIVYKKELEKTVKPLIENAEGIYIILKKQMKTEPINKINILLTDQADVPNGFALTLPNNTINLYLTVSGPDFISKEDNWLEYVLLHEMTHIFNLSTTNPSCLKYLNNSFLYFPDVGMPMYMLEGYTVYNESTILNGRLFDTNYEAHLRTMILDNDIQPLDRAISYSNSDYPYGTLAYIYGAYIYNEYMNEKKSLTNFNSTYGLTCCSYGTVFPDISAKIQTGYLPNTMLERAIENAKTRTNELIASINPNERYAITNTGDENKLPVLYKNKLYFIGTFDNSSSYLSAIENNKTVKLQRVRATKSLCFTNINNEDIVFFEILSMYNNIDLYYDIYSYNLQTHKLKKYKNTRRGMYPIIYKDKMIFIRNNFDKQQFIVYDLEKEMPIDSFSFENNFRYFNPDINENGEILVSVYRNGFTDIALIDLNMQEKASDDITIKFLTQNRAVDFYPKWNKDNSGYYFISDYTKINQIYYYSFEDQSLREVYQTLYNTMSYDIDEESRIIYVQDLSSKGFDIYSANIDTYNFLIDFEKEELKPYSPIIANNIKIKTKNYTPGLPASMGMFFLLPFPIISEDTITNINSMDLNLYGFYENSDIAHGLYYSINFFPFIYSSQYDSTDQLINDFYYYNIVQTLDIYNFTPDIRLALQLINDSSDFTPDSFEIALTYSKTFFSPFKNHSIAVSGLYGNSNLEYTGISFENYNHFNLDYGIKNVALSSGIIFDWGIYYYFDINNTSNYNFGGNIVLGKYFSIGNYSPYVKLQSYYDNNSDISLENTGVIIDSIDISIIKPSLSSYGFPNTTMFFEDLHNLTLGISAPIAFINRGIPLSCLISMPIKFKYLSHTFDANLYYSNSSSFDNITLTYSISIPFDVAIISLTPTVFVNYSYNEKLITYGFLIF